MKRKIMLLGLVCVSMMSTPLLAVETGYEDKKSFVDRAKKSWKTFKKDMRCAWRGNCTEEQQNRLIKQGLALAAVVGTLLVGGRWMRQRSLEKRYELLRSSTEDDRKMKEEVVNKDVENPKMEYDESAEEFFKEYETSLDLAIGQASQGNYGVALRLLNDAIEKLDEAYNKATKK